jgi:hypothetical protein
MKCECKYVFLLGILFVFESRCACSYKQMVYGLYNIHITN